MMSDAGSDIVEAEACPSLLPNLSVLLIGSSAVALISMLTLPWPLGIASTLLGIVMVAGAEVDARTFLLPDFVTYGATACGLVVAPVIDPGGVAEALRDAGLRALATAVAVFLMRRAYRCFRGQEGLGFGDVKLAAAVGAWLPLQAIPYCFSLASTAALIYVTIVRRKEARAGMKLPFGAFLCPALWLIFFLSVVRH